MGCDIHLFAEIKINGNWIADLERTAEMYDYDGSNRVYAAFAILAGVRNDLNIIPIAEPKGIPADASESYKIVCEDWGKDGHSHSYLTLKEFNNYNYCFAEGALTTEQMKRLANAKNHIDNNIFSNFDACREEDEVRIVFFFDN